MNTNNKRTIKFEVKDYSKYEYECCKDDISKELAKKIFIKAAEKINEKIINNKDEFIVGRSASRKNENIIFYDESFNVGMIQGIVGVVFVNDIKLIEDDFDSENEKDEYTSKYDSTCDVQITVKSRFDSDKAYFLSTMLLNADTKLNNYDIDFSYDNIFEFMLVILFKKYFLEAYRDGFYRTYQCFENNDERLKGRIDVARHIKLNTAMDNGKIAYSYRDNTIDNSFNHLILHTYLYMKSKFSNLVDKIIDSDYEMKKIIDDLKFNAQSYIKCDVRTVINKCTKPIVHPLYFNYEHLRTTCIMILNNIGISIFDGNEKDIQGLLYYIPDLWEEFLNNQLFKNLECKYEYQKLIEVFIKENNKGKGTYPDFVFINGEGQPFYILDAKFKPGWFDAYNNGNLGRMLDDYTKCIRDMNSINAHAVGTIFPTNNRIMYEHDKISHGISELNKEDEFHCFPVYVPQSNDKLYNEWMKEFDESITKASNWVKKYLNNMQLKGKLNEIQNEIRILEKYKYEKIKDVVNDLKNKSEELQKYKVETEHEG